MQCRAYTHTHDAALVDDLLYDLAVLADDLADEGARHLDGLLGVLQQRARRLHRVRRLREMTVHYSYSILNKQHSQEYNSITPFYHKIHVAQNLCCIHVSVHEFVYI